MLARRVLAAFVLLLGTGFATAQTGPELLTVFPPGARAGETVEVAFSGAGFDGDEQLLFSGKGFKSELVGAATPEPKGKKGGGPATASVKFKVTAPKDLGTYDVRVVSKSGLSNPRAFVVGDLAEVNELEPNNDVGQAQKIEINTTVNGVISAPTDVDYVSFKAKAGQNIVVYCLTTSIDSKLSADLMVATADGKRLAENRGYRGGDAVLDFKVPADGDYLVRVSQFAYTTGGTDHFYRLTVTDGPWVDALWPPINTGSWIPYTKHGPGIALVGNRAKDGPPRSSVIPPSAGMIDAIDSPRGSHLLLEQENEVTLDNDKNATADTSQVVKLPCDIAGRIGKKNDRHWYSFDAKKGEVWTLEVFADRIGSQMDAFFVLTDDKGKVIVEMDDGPDSLSPNQFYTKSDDPARYRFAVPADGKYRVMVSSRDAGIVFGVREQYVLRIAKENPDFRLAVMGTTPHLPEAGTVQRNGAVLFNVYAFRMDGFNDPIVLEAKNLPPGVKCPPQIIGTGQTRGTLVLTAEKDAKDWDGFVTISGTGEKLKRDVRPFTITWPVQGLQAGQPPPNIPMITRMDRGPGLALAVRGEAPFTLTPTETELKAKAGDKLEVTLKITREEKFKDNILIFSAVPNFGPRQPGNQPLQPITTITPDKTEMKINVDVQANTQPGTYTLVLRGQSGAPVPKAPNNAVRPAPSHPALPITVVIEGTPKKK
jgi:Bacterial pre-peptidase C-terminal domain